MNTLISQVFTIMAAGLCWLGYEWFAVGFGLNPFVAFPAASVLLIIPHAVSRYFETPVVLVDAYPLEVLQQVEGYVTISGGIATLEDGEQLVL